MAADPVLHRDEFTRRKSTPANNLNADATEFHPRGLNPEAREFLPASKVGSGTKPALFILCAD